MKIDMMDFDDSDGIESDKVVIFKQDDLHSESFPLMKEIRRQGKLCDVTIKVENQSFSAHRIVLASTIPYFYAMFTNDMTESRVKEITMKEIDPLAFELLINFAYSGSVKIDNQNVQTLMMGAAFLQLNKVRDACADFLASRFHAQNVLGIRQFADSLGCSQLIKEADKYINSNFADIGQSDEFSNLSFEEVIDILHRDELEVPSERDVFEACMRWIKWDESRIPLLPKALSKVRLPLLTPQFLTDRVQTEELIRSSHKCRDLLDEAKDFHLMPERRDLVQSFRTRPRGSDVMGLIFAVGGLTKNGESISTVEIYDPFTREWRVGEAMSMLRSRVGVAVTGGKLFAFGGYNGTERLSTVEVYDPKAKIWSKAKEMQCKRSAVGVAALGDRVYICGGYDGATSLNIAECYFPKTDTWATVAPMMKFRSAGGVAALNNYVYAVGGHDGLSIFDSCERYDPKENTWTKVTPMLERRCRLGVAALNGKLYAAGGYSGSFFLKSVEEYDPVTDKWRYIASMNVSRSRVALCANMGKLWAVGGYDGSNNLSSTEVWDPESNAWKMAENMLLHGGGVGIGVIPIS